MVHGSWSYRRISGSNCEINVNECASSPCLHGGSCQDAVGGYVCFCARAWEGRHCEVGVNECLSNPCANGGVCEDAIGGYVCACADGFAGV